MIPRGSEMNFKGSEWVSGGFSPSRLTAASAGPQHHSRASPFGEYRSGCMAGKTAPAMSSLSIFLLFGGALLGGTGSAINEEAEA
jgi:hypothetical protein